MLRSFNTTVDIRLKHWAEKELPKLCVNVSLVFKKKHLLINNVYLQVGTQVLLQEFEKLILKDQSKKAHDTILDSLKIAIKNSANTRHNWDEKALDSLVNIVFWGFWDCIIYFFVVVKFKRVIQLNALEDRSVPDKYSWDSAITFMDSVLKEKLNEG